VKYKGVLLDLDNTLYDYDTAHRHALEKAIGFLSAESGMDEDRLREGYREARAYVNKARANTASSHCRALYFQRLCETLALNPGRYVYEADELYWGTFIGRMPIFPDVPAFLDKISGLKLVLVTDLLAHIQFRKIRAMGLDHWVSMVVTSEETGVEKPNPVIFQVALQKIGLGVQDVCMIGDDFKKDIMGAVAMGIPAFWLNRKNEALPPELSDKVTPYQDYETLRGYFDE